MRAVSDLSEAPFREFLEDHVAEFSAPAQGCEGPPVVALLVADVRHHLIESSSLVLVAGDAEC